MAWLRHNEDIGDITVRHVHRAVQIQLNCQMHISVNYYMFNS